MAWTFTNCVKKRWCHVFSYFRGALMLEFWRYIENLIMLGNEMWVTKLLYKFFAKLYNFVTVNGIIPYFPCTSGFWFIKQNWFRIELKVPQFKVHVYVYITFPEIGYVKVMYLHQKVCKITVHQYADIIPECMVTCTTTIYVTFCITKQKFY